MTQLNQSQINDLKAAHDAGDRVTYYSVLEAAGVTYGALAKGVATGDTISGSTANVFLAEQALRKYDVVVTQDMAEQIGVSLTRFIHEGCNFLPLDQDCADGLRLDNRDPLRWY